MIPEHTLPPNKKKRVSHKKKKQSKKMCALKSSTNRCVFSLKEDGKCNLSEKGRCIKRKTKQITKKKHCAISSKSNRCVYALHSDGKCNLSEKGRCLKRKTQNNKPKKQNNKSKNKPKKQNNKPIKLINPRRSPTSNSLKFYLRIGGPEDGAVIKLIPLNSLNKTVSDWYNERYKGPWGKIHEEWSTTKPKFKVTDFFHPNIGKTAYLTMEIYNISLRKEFTFDRDDHTKVEMLSTVMDYIYPDVVCNFPIDLRGKKYCVKVDTDSLITNNYPPTPSTDGTNSADIQIPLMSPRSI